LTLISEISAERRRHCIRAALKSDTQHAVHALLCHGI